MSDWTIKPENIIQEELFAKGYRVLWLSNALFEAKTPDGQRVEISRNQSDCWTKCYQHNEESHHSKEIEVLRQQNESFKQALRSVHDIVTEGLRTDDGGASYWQIEADIAAALELSDKERDI